MLGSLGDASWIVIAVAVLAVFLSVLVILHLRRTKARITDIQVAGVRLGFDHDDKAESPNAAPQKAAAPPIPNVFDRSDSALFASCAETLLKTAKRAIFIGTGLNLLQRDPIFHDLADRAARGDCTVEVFMANPWSPDIITRLVEEELGGEKPPVGQQGLILRMQAILHKLRILGWPGNFSVKLFWNYPTFALCIIDDHYFTYSYGYARLGNFSPVEHYERSSKDHQPMIAFFDRQYVAIKEASADARLAFSLYRPDPSEPASRDRLQALAVYLVPPMDSPLYEFGSRVLGYDVRERRQIESRWRHDAGTAAHFGFHLTVADALYFTSVSEAERVRKELEFMLKDFPRFWLTDFELVPGFPDERSISLRCRDRGRALEALHFEMMSIVYRRAAASNYTLGLAGRRYEGDHGSDLMIARYRAPYILSSFSPHWTLLSNVAPERLEETAAEVSAFFEQHVPSRSIEIAKVAVMSQPSSGAPWQIEREIPLH